MIDMSPSWEVPTALPKGLQYTVFIVIKTSEEKLEVNFYIEIGEKMKTTWIVMRRKHVRKSKKKDEMKKDGEDENINKESERGKNNKSKKVMKKL